MSQELNVTMEHIHNKLNEFINSNHKVKHDLIKFHNACEEMKKIGFLFEVVSCITNECVFSVFDIKENTYLLTNQITKTFEESLETAMNAINKKMLKIS